MLRDRIASGLANAKLRDDLIFSERALNLEQVLAKVRSTEQVKKESQQLNAEKSDVAAVRGTRPKQRRERGHRDKKQDGHPKSERTCYRCGDAPHRKHECPAFNQTCRKCDRRGHYAKMCRTKDSKNVRAVEDQEEPVFMGKITVINHVEKDDDFSINLRVNSRQVTFKVDTGADVTVVGENNLNRRNIPQLQKPDRMLAGANMQKLDVLGYFHAKLQTGSGHSCVEKIYVTRNLKHPLLGKPAIKALKLIECLFEVDDDTNNSEAYREKIFADFPQLFEGLGHMAGCEYEIRLRENAQPYSISTPRRIAQPLLPKVKKELDSMEELGVIRRLDDNEVSDYMSPIVVVPKKNGKVRICVDLTKLNENIIRPRHQLPSVDETLARLGHGKLFSKLDANSGFWQVPLAEKSQLLTTFLTPFGRYCHTRLPFGITSGPEFFQQKMDALIKDLPQATCLIDDIAIATPESDAESHRAKLYPVLKKLQDAGVTLNREKCEFFVSGVEFVGHKITEHGIKADDKKLAAVRDMPEPQNITELRSFLGLCQQLAKFSHKLANLIEPLRALLSDKNEFVWAPNHTAAFQEIKTELTSPRVLQPYQPDKETKIMTDASRSGFGAILLQKSDKEFHPVCFASKSLSHAEKRYSVIELEAASIVYACQKFDKYILGMKVSIETDHKPLIPLLGEKSLDRLPPRIVRFRLALMRYEFTVKHVPGKENLIADCLSRASVTDQQPSVIEHDAEEYVNALLGNMPASDRKLDLIKEMQQEDEICLKLSEYSNIGWPDPKDIPSVLKPYSTFKDEFSLCQGLLLKGDRIVIPSSMRLEMLECLHSGHLGIEKTRKRLTDSMWWPNAYKQVEDLVKNCRICCSNQRDHAEPQIPTPLPSRPWQKVAADICDTQGKKFLVVYDYYSRWLEFCPLPNMNASTLVTCFKSVCARYGIFETLVCDNQFDCAAINNFANEYGVTVVTSSPRFPSANGAAERAVQTFKNLMKKNNDPYIALLAYRCTPLADGFSPAEKLFGRKLRSNVPQAPKKLVSSYSDAVKQHIKTTDDRLKNMQKLYHDRRHDARDKPDLQTGDNVLMRDRNEEATVNSPAKNAPRSVIVSTDNNTYRRNTRMLDRLPARPPRDRRAPRRFDDYVM